MKEIFISLAKLLATDNKFRYDFSSAPTDDAKYSLLKTKFNNLTQKDFSDFLKVLNQAKKSSITELSPNEMQMIAGGTSTLVTKLAATAILFAAMGATGLTSQQVDASAIHFETVSKSATNISNLSEADIETVKGLLSNLDFCCSLLITASSLAQPSAGDRPDTTSIPVTQSVTAATGSPLTFTPRSKISIGESKKATPLVLSNISQNSTLQLKNSSLVIDQTPENIRGAVNPVNYNELRAQLTSSSLPQLVSSTKTAGIELSFDPQTLLNPSNLEEFKAVLDRLSQVVKSYVMLYVDESSAVYNAVASPEVKKFIATVVKITVDSGGGVKNLGVATNYIRGELNAVVDKKYRSQWDLPSSKVAAMEKEINFINTKALTDASFKKFAYLPFSSIIDNIDVEHSNDSAERFKVLKKNFCHIMVGDLANTQRASFTPRMGHCSKYVHDFCRAISKSWLDTVGIRDDDMLIGPFGNIKGSRYSMFVTLEGATPVFNSGGHFAPTTGDDSLKAESISVSYGVGCLNSVTVFPQAWGWDEIKAAAKLCLEHGKKTFDEKTNHFKYRLPANDPHNPHGFNIVTIIGEDNVLVTCYPELKQGR